MLKNNCLRLGYIGTKEMVQYVEGACNTLVPPSLNRKRVAKSFTRSNKNTWEYFIGGQRAVNFLTILNQIQIPKMERKWSKLQLVTKSVYNQGQKRKSRIKGKED